MSEKLHQDNACYSAEKPQKLLLLNPIPEKQNSAKPGSHYITGADDGKQGGCRLIGCQNKNDKIGKTVENAGRYPCQADLNPFLFLKWQDE